jgi:2-desacetyl-2-hydroxyethyl bacteriochlorophyllide A dehydrogenase
MQVLGVHVDGGMREEIVVPASKLHPSSVLSYDQLALVETLGIGAHAVDRARLDPEESVLVIGAGPIGLSVIQFATVVGARVFLMEISPHRVDFCRRHFRIEGVLDETHDPVSALEEMLSGDLPTAVFDATGNPDSMMAALQYVASGGRLVFVGLCQHDITFWDPEFHRREMTLYASRNALGTDFTRIIQLVEAGEIDTSPWITHRASFENCVEQFSGWLEPEAGVLKTMLSL